MTAPWELDIADAARRIAARELGVAEYVTDVLDRLAVTEPVVGAWQLVDGAGALAAAKQADADIARGDYRGPLHGIPFGVKDVIDTAGLATEAGSHAYVGRVPDRDAVSVANLRRAGAILLGKTVTHEIAYGQNHPPTRNPWDADRYAGGSSVGSGVAVAVGSAPGCLGTDTGGSVRNPASVNGVVGLRPTTGLIDTTGTVPLTAQLDQIGPLARSALDCALLLAGMRGSADDVAAQVTRPARGTVRIGIDSTTWTELHIAPEVVDTVSAAAEELAQAGAEIVDVRLPELRLGLPTTLIFSLADAAEHHRAALTARADEFDPATRVMLELGYVLTAEQRDLARRARQYLQQRIRAVFDGAALTALLSPTLPALPPLLADLATDLTRDGEAADLSAALLLLSPANVCGLPGLSLPCAPADGLPVGMHLLGRPLGDLDLLRIAFDYQSRTSWHRSRPSL